MYFHREFPKLGGGEAKVGAGEDVKGDDHREESVQDASHQAMGHPEFICEYYNDRIYM